MSDSAATQKSVSRTTILVEFLGSMNLAITLLVAVAIASIVGTVLKQNEPYQNYIIKFGPFWHEVFQSLGLYDVYSAGWFLFILTFLVISTSVCIYRNAPVMVRDMRHFRLKVSEVSLRGFHHQAEWRSAADLDATQQRIGAVLGRAGYRLRSKDHPDHRLIAAKKGSINRLGYLFTHTAIVLICVGGLVDGNLGLKLKAMSGQVKPETRDIPASEVPQISWLPEGNPSFRGNVNIPEGGSATIVFLQLRDGYLVQPLPFRIELRDFRIEHYASGQPKSFESDLVIHDEERDAPLEATIAVNHPLVYKGYAIYQASFNDGGTRMSLKAWSLSHPTVEVHEFPTAVFETMDVETATGHLTLEMNDFRLFNINPAPEGSGKKFENNGPTIKFKLRNAQGEAREYENYMIPLELEGRRFYLSGVRSTPSDPFFYLHVPADPDDGGLDRFMNFKALLHNAEQVRAIAAETTRATFSDMRLDQPGVQQEIVNTMQRLVEQFANGGFEAIAQSVEAHVPEEKRASVMDAYMKVLRNVLSALYAHVLEQEGVDLSNGISERDGLFYNDAINAIASLPAYGSPFFLQLTNFDQVQASGLQIAKAPGKSVVYLGFLLLSAGVFMMFYIHPRRLWLRLTPDGAGTQVLFGAAPGERNQSQFAQEFDAIKARLEQALQKTE